MGMLRIRQGKPEEARKSLENAVAANSQNYLIHYYYAYVLSRESSSDMLVMSFAPDTATRIRAELEKAIELRPDFPDSYSLMAFVNLVTGTQLDETVELLKRALSLSPGRNDLLFTLAQVYMRKEDLKTARQLLEKLSGNSSDEDVRQRARMQLVQLDSVEEMKERMRAFNEMRASQPSPMLGDSAGVGGETAVEKNDPSSYLREALRKPASDERQTQGTLVRIECDARGITFVVMTGQRLLKLKTDSFEHVDITSFSPDAGNEITCGPRKPENNVILIYVPASDARAKVDGVAKSVEFVPKDFKLN
jgi:Tfp pilus assembly protein PilF